MRDISSLTVGEGAGLWDAVMPKVHTPFRGPAIHFPADDAEGLPERVVFMQGVERLGVRFDGRVWADTDLDPIELDQDKVKTYLLSINIAI